MLADVAALGLIQDVADVLAGVAQMLEPGNKMVDGLLEEDVVFPERVIRINEERVACHSKFSGSTAAPAVKNQRPNPYPGGRALPLIQEAEALRMPSARRSRISRAIFCVSPKRVR